MATANLTKASAGLDCIRKHLQHVIDEAFRALSLLAGARALADIDKAPFKSEDDHWLAMNSIEGADRAMKRLDTLRRVADEMQVGRLAFDWLALELHRERAKAHIEIASAVLDATADRDSHDAALSAIQLFALAGQSLERVERDLFAAQALAEPGEGGQ